MQRNLFLCPEIPTGSLPVNMSVLGKFPCIHYFFAAAILHTFLHGRQISLHFEILDLL